MAIQSLEYFYDRQQVRFLEQVVRAFSGFQYMAGASNGNPPTLMTVPCRMASTNSMVANIIRNQSVNTLLTVPMITIWQTNITFDQDRLQNRNHVDTLQVVERAIDPITGKYTADRGQGYTVQRLMPIPFTMHIKVDLWTSNTDQKYQLEEQILTIMCPSFDIQNSQNALDWTALTTVYIKEITHSSRNIPVGSDSEIDIMSFLLEIPIWLSPPASLTKQTIIDQIIANITDTAPLLDVISDTTYAGARFTQRIITPGMNFIHVNGNVITLLGEKGRILDDNGNPYIWKDLLNQYGEMRPAVSRLALKTSENIEGPSVFGTIQLNPSNPSQLSWQIDPTSLPANTLTAVDAVINPLNNFPTSGGLPDPIEGTRYLILHDLGPSVAWGQIAARYGDIIMFTNGAWTVDFSAVGSSQQYVLNKHTGKQLRWNGEDWVIALDGEYSPGYWSLDL